MAKIKTFYYLLFLMGLLILCVMIISPVLFMGKFILSGLLFFFIWRIFYSFSVQSLEVRKNNCLVIEKGQVYEADYQPTTVIARHLCFLHLQTAEGGKRWWIPVSRLEFSKATFRRLKYELQCHSP